MKLEHWRKGHNCGVNVNQDKEGPNRALLCDYESSCGPWFEALVASRVSGEESWGENTEQGPGWAPLHYGHDTAIIHHLRPGPDHALLHCMSWQPSQYLELSTTSRNNNFLWVVTCNRPGRQHRNSLCVHIWLKWYIILGMAWEKNEEWRTKHPAANTTYLFKW